MKLLLILLFPLFAYAGPFEDRAQTFVDSLTGQETDAAKVTMLLDMSVVTYQAWIPTELVVVGVDSDGNDITEERTQDPTAWTRERKARFFINSVRREVQQRARRAAEQIASIQAKSIADATIKAAGDNAEIGL
jgi:hypothetical protein